MRPEETAGYDGLYGEVVTEDIYRLRKLDFVPDVIFDIGANIGVFSRFARELFPHAMIVAVEPHPENFEILRAHRPVDPVVVLNKALGRGQVWHEAGAANGSGQVYISESIGYPADILNVPDPQRERAAVTPVMLSELATSYLEPKQRLLIKVDCEGAEGVIFEDPASMTVVRRADYFAAEIHRYAATAVSHVAMEAALEASLANLTETHDCDREHVMFYARRKY